MNFFLSRIVASLVLSLVAGGRNEPTRINRKSRFVDNFHNLTLKLPVFLFCCFYRKNFLSPLLRFEPTTSEIFRFQTRKTITLKNIVEWEKRRSFSIAQNSIASDLIKKIFSIFKPSITFVNMIWVNKSSKLLPCEHFSRHHQKILNFLNFIVFALGKICKQDYTEHEQYSSERISQVVNFSK